VKGLPCFIKERPLNERGDFSHCNIGDSVTSWNKGHKEIFETINVVHMHMGIFYICNGILQFLE
jgi:hypothetical protein